MPLSLLELLEKLLGGTGSRKAAQKLRRGSTNGNRATSIDDKKTTASMVSRMEALQKELRSLSEGIWHQERKLDMVHARLGSLPLRRALVSCCKDKDWYLSEWMRTECARRKGCCARECGCCRRTRSERRPQHRGHCTAACACCEQSRGFAVTGKDAWEPMQMALRSNQKTLNLYATRLRDAYFFGL
ncbi:hypothetical protein BO82DRAFT_431451 [Aspergillus uvarum CBS 121591]|uniref:Uncharacterized protein n=1 Tax=Aspergillus uvarum CBS 121591 TaxID=1448315 RepID=A0A319CEZ3_9EURO|nr:hypothetical protein BO82DRAFT_431451 [Aspergillus uvarum CBS 121591]PYH82849.1 hypothetical protein BO82DRAFT_431451 [Aspergillus uvarum CBS 121591]